MPRSRSIRSSLLLVCSDPIHGIRTNDLGTQVVPDRKALNALERQVSDAVNSLHDETKAKIGDRRPQPTPGGAVYYLVATTASTDPSWLPTSALLTFPALSHEGFTFLSAFLQAKAKALGYQER